MDRPQPDRREALLGSPSDTSTVAATAAPESAGCDESAESELVGRWIDAFNARDLEAMLSCVAPWISFQPLRLHGVERTYSGHDGITRWHERLLRLGLDYQIQIERLTMPAEGTVLATGGLNLEGMSSAAPFWGVHTIDGGLIIVARHYLGDAEMAERFALRD